MKRHKRTNHLSGIPPSAGLTPEARGVSWGILGVSGILSDLQEIISGRSPLKWYDQVLHVVGAVIILGLLVGSLIQIVSRW